MTEKISTKTNMSGDVEERYDLDTVDLNRLPCPIGAAIQERMVDIANDECDISTITEEEYIISGLIDMSGDTIPETPKVKEGHIYCILEIDQSIFCIGKTSMNFNANMDDVTTDARMNAFEIAAIHSLITHDKLACTCGEHDIQLINVPTNDLHYTGFAKS